RAADFSARPGEQTERWYFDRRARRNDAIGVVVAPNRCTTLLAHVLSATLRAEPRVVLWIPERHLVDEMAVAANLRGVVFAHSLHPSGSLTIVRSARPMSCTTRLVGLRQE